MTKLNGNESSFGIRGIEQYSTPRIANIGSANGSNFNNKPASMGFTQTMGNASSASTGSNVFGNTVALLGTLGSLYQARQNYKLGKQEFEFNKKDSNRNFELAKDSYDRKVRRADNISANRIKAEKDYAERFGNRAKNKNTSIANKPRIANQT